MAITVSGTTLTFNDATTQTSAAGFVTGGSVLNGTSNSYTFTGIPTTATQIWLVFSLGYINTSTETLVLQAQTSGGTAGTLSGQSSFITVYSNACRYIQTNGTTTNMALAADSPSYMNEGVLLLTKINSTSYEFQLDSSMSVTTTKYTTNRGMITTGSEITRIYIGCTVSSWANAQIQLYWEG